MATKCAFCERDGIHQVEAPAIKLCDECRKKLDSHIAVVCTGCNVIHWLPKSAANVAAAAEMSGLLPDHIMENPIVHEIKFCKNCYVASAEFSKSAEWKQ